MIQAAEKENSSTIENFNSAIVTVRPFQDWTKFFLALEYLTAPRALERGKKNPGWHLLRSVQNE